MECDHYVVLSKVARIVGASAGDPPRCIKELLCFLAGALVLDELTFYLYEPRQKIFFRTISSSGADLFVPLIHPAAGTPEGTALKRQRPEWGPGALHLPVGSRRPGLGVLALHPAPHLPLSAGLERLLQAVCDQLAVLAQFSLLAETERRRRLQLSLLSELGRALGRGDTQGEVLQEAARTLRRHSGVACVVLRPLHGGTVLGRRLVRLAPGWQPLRSLLLELEEEYATRALAAQAPLFQQGAGSWLTETPGLPPVMVSIPLIFQSRALGVLTLFGSLSDEVLPLAASREAKELLSTIGSRIAQALERVAALERLEEVSAQNDRKLREVTLLFRIARAMHSTLRLNELLHLILSAATVPGGGGFERAMLFMLNERSGILQGMLCVTSDTASLVLPPEGEGLAWQRPVVSEQALDQQRRHPCCRQVMQQRISLAEESAPARAVRLRRVVLVSGPEADPSSVAVFARELQLGAYACAPLYGRDRPLGVLVVDNPQGREEIPPSRLGFLELFANLAGAAMENSMLLNRLETAHQELRETQERLIQGEKMAVLGEMAASVAHELRNPLVAIGGFAQRLARIAGAGREQEYASIIAREVHRMEEMLGNILAFTKKQMLCFAECHVPRLIDEAMTLEFDALTRGAVRLVTEIAEPLPVIQGDAQKLRQVMINLIANARQAMAAGGVLTVRAYSATLRGDAAVAVEVEDTGGGIPADILRNIFNPFFTTKEAGTGLGLSISHRIVEQHRGQIEVENRVGGAAFILRLPVRAADAPLH